MPLTLTRFSLLAVSSARIASRPCARPSLVRFPAGTGRPNIGRTYASETSSPGAGNQMYVVLAAIAALGAGGYFYLKPMRDVAATANSAIQVAKEKGTGAGDSFATIAKSILPPSVLALYTQLGSQPGGINGLLSSLKDKDLHGVLEELKAAGGDDIRRVVEKVEAKVKDADGKVENIDWRGLALSLKEELGESSQKAIDLLVGQLPSKEDFDKLIEQAQTIGEEQLKQVETAASKVYKGFEKAKKEGKTKTGAFLQGLNETDLDDLINQLKGAASKAGLPADTVESWLRSKADDGKSNAEYTIKQVMDKLRATAKLLPGEPKEVVDKVGQVSPSLAKLLQQALVDANITDEKGNRK